jgi:pectate lyase
MKIIPIVAGLCALVSAAPLGDVGTILHSRQAGETCTLGYCTQNGGTTGGSGGRTVTVTDVNSLASAANSDERLTIIIRGSISGSANIRVGSNKTIFGERGSCEQSRDDPPFTQAYWKSGETNVMA